MKRTAIILISLLFFIIPLISVYAEKDSLPEDEFEEFVPFSDSSTRCSLSCNYCDSVLS